MQRDGERRTEIGRRVEILRAWDDGRIRTGEAVEQLGVSDRAARNLREQWKAAGTVSAPLRPITVVCKDQVPFVLRDSPMAYTNPYAAWTKACARAGLPI